MNINYWSSVGLIADISGALIIFRHGLPSKHSEGIHLGIDETSEAEAIRLTKNKRIESYSKIGLILLTLGFILQLIGANYQYRISTKATKATNTIIKTQN